MFYFITKSILKYGEISQWVVTGWSKRTDGSGSLGRIALEFGGPLSAAAHVERCYASTWLMYTYGTGNAPDADDHDDFFFFRKKQREQQNTGSFSDCHVDFGGDRGEISRSYGSSHNDMAHRLRVESVRFRYQTFPCRWSKCWSQVEVFTTK